MGDAEVTSGRSRVVCTPMMRHLLSLISTKIPPISNRDTIEYGRGWWADLPTKKESKTMIQECKREVMNMITKGVGDMMDLRRFMYARLKEQDESVERLNREVMKVMRKVESVLPQWSSAPTPTPTPTPTYYNANDFMARLHKYHARKPTMITNAFIIEDHEPTPDNHMKTWTEQERDVLAEELVRFLRKQARRHKRTPSSIAFSIVRALKGAGVELL